MSDLSTELRHAGRRLRRTPVFTATTLIVLVLGLGATTTMFAIVDGIVLRPLPYAQPEQLVDVSHSIAVSGITHVNESDASFMLYQRHNQVFSGIAATRDRSANLGVKAGAPGEARRLSVTGVSANFFDVLRVTPMRGRTFVAGEDQTGAPRVVILSAGLWRRQFGAADNIIGQEILIDGIQRQVVGVMPAAFTYPSASTELWYPIPFDAAHSDPGSFNYQSIARLKPGVTREAATTDLTRILPRLLDEFQSDIPKAMFEQAHLAPVVTPLRDVIVGDAPRLLWILFAAVLAVWLIACANVANLVLVRAEGRQREMAVRTALGAGRGAVFTQYLSEATIVAAAGGAGSVALAAVAIRSLSSLPQGIDVPRLSDVALDGRVLVFALVATILTAFLVSLVPVLRARRIPIAAVLKESGRAATTGAERQRTRSALVVAQVALALVLVATSGLLARSFNRLRAVQPGWDSSNRVALRYSLPSTQYHTATAIAAFHERLLNSVRALPGVIDAGLTTWLPLSDDNSNSVVEVEDHPLPPNSVPPVHDYVNVSDDFFATMGIPVLAGGVFSRQDVARPQLEAVVSRAFAERYWKGASALGKRVRQGIDGPWSTVVGVVGDVHLASLEKPAPDAIYFPIVKRVDGGSVRRIRRWRSSFTPVAIRRRCRRQSAESFTSSTRACRRTTSSRCRRSCAAPRVARASSRCSSP